MTFAHGILAERRILAGLTVPALAERAGITAQALRNIERGVSVPRPSTALALAAALDVPTSDLWITSERAA